MPVVARANNEKLKDAKALARKAVKLVRPTKARVGPQVAWSMARGGQGFGRLINEPWAIGTLILKRSDVDVPATVLTGWQLLVTAVPIAAGALILGDHQWFVPSWTSIAVFAWIALIPMSIGNVAWFAIVGLLPANVAGLSSIMVPVVAMISGAIVHGEPLGVLQWLAIACCVSALSLALIRPAAER